MVLQERLHLNQKIRHVLYKSLNQTNNNKGGTITVVDRDETICENNCDTSFNKNIQIEGNAIIIY